MRKFILLIIFFNCLNFLLLSQTLNPREYDYSHVDILALNTPKNNFKNISDLANTLTKNLKNDNEKFRVVFRWITDNIEYSYSNYTSNADTVFKYKKAVCSGYASLLKALCDDIGIECKVVRGYAKIGGENIGAKLTKKNHDWNIVKIYDKWYLVDVTWASGTYMGKFIKNFDESYFLSDPNFFIFCHFPEDKQYQLLDKQCQVYDFIKFPIVYSAIITPIELNSGEVKGDLFIKFITKKNINKIALKFLNKQYGRPLNIVNNNGIYEIKYIFKKTDNGEFYIFVNDICVFVFVRK